MLPNFNHENGHGALQRFSRLRNIVLTSESRPMVRVKVKGEEQFWHKHYKGALQPTLIVWIPNTKAQDFMDAVNISLSVISQTN